MSGHDDFPPATNFDDEDIPVIGADMLHQDAVDFEAGMSAWPVVSLTIITVCIAAFAAQGLNGGLENVDKLVAMGALERQKVEQGEFWRVLSATFLHGGIDHLIGNLVILFILGMACEHGFGRPQFLVLYVTAGVAGSLLSLTGGRPSVGASGAIFGLAGALIVLFWQHRRRLYLRDRRIGVVLAAWAVYQLVLGLLNPAVDNRAHLGGLLGGMLVALILRPAVLDGRREVAVRPITLVGVVLAALALLATAAYFLPRLVAAS